MNILFCSSEVFPFAKTGGLADVCGTLPLALEKLGHRIVVAMPRYMEVNAPRGLQRVNNHFSKTLMGKNIPVFFVENEKYFGREGIYGYQGDDFSDNLARFQFFCEEVLAIPAQLGIDIDVVHCHDWQTALIPFYLKGTAGAKTGFRRAKSVFTIHNMAFQGIFPRTQFSQLGLSENFFSPAALEFYGQINLLKGGIVAADRVTTVSPTYAREIQTKEFGCGLEGVLSARGGQVAGILNGLDYGVWDPATDPLIDHPYPPDVKLQKKRNKTALQQACGLPVDGDIPVFGFVGRLSHQKGIDLIVQAAREWLRLNIQVVFVGVGEEKYQDMLQEIVDEHPDKVAVSLQFDERRGHQIYAGSDFFMMPSVYEPCGLSQIIALKYGTIPVVYKTGGLADTISPYEAQGNGFVFADYSVGAFMAQLRRAVALYQDTAELSAVIDRALAENFSWDESAKKYDELYKEVVARP